MNAPQPRPEEIRAARAFLNSPKTLARFDRIGVSQARIRPRTFAASARELSVGFDQLMDLIEHLSMGGQGAQMQRKKIIARQLPAAQGGTGILGAAGELA